MKPEDMSTMQDALRWALRRIEIAGLGEGEFFHQADRVLSEHERINQPPLALATADVLRERLRQVSKGYDAEHDAGHGYKILAAAGAAYALAMTGPQGRALSAEFYPWDAEGGPVVGGQREMMVKAAALMLAAIECFDHIESDIIENADYLA